MTINPQDLAPIKAFSEAMNGLESPKRIEDDSLSLDGGLLTLDFDQITVSHPALGAKTEERISVQGWRLYVATWSPGTCNDPPNCDLREVASERSLRAILSTAAHVLLDERLMRVHESMITPDDLGDLDSDPPSLSDLISKLLQPAKNPRLR